MKSTIIRTGFDTLYFSGAHVLLRRFFEGVGAILMLHHVRPPRSSEFQPNQGLEVSPEFLMHTIEWLRSEAIDIVSLDEMHRRLTERDFGRRFACITFDDGYRDNKVMGLSDPQGAPGAVRDLHSDQLPRSPRQAVVGRAGDGDRRQRQRRGDDQRQGAAP